MKKKRFNKKSISSSILKNNKKEEVITPIEIINAVSVIIPVKDRPESTKKLLDELVYQKNTYYPETEIIVIENGSTEDMSFLEDYKDVVLKHEKIIGAAHARNVGLDLARSTYIAFIDNDDFITEDYLHQLYQTMRTTKCDWCLIAWTVDGEDIQIKVDLNNPLETCWGCPHYCYHRRIIGNKRLNEKLNVAEDIEWLPLIITPETKGAFIEKPIYNVTWAGNEESLSHRFNRGELTKEK